MCRDFSSNCWRVQKVVSVIALSLVFEETAGREGSVHLGRKAEDVCELVDLMIKIYDTPTKSICWNPY